MVRLRLADDADISSLHFDLPNRTLRAIHHTSPDMLVAALNSIGFPAQVMAHTQIADSANIDITASNTDRKLLWQVLVINTAAFLLCLITGLVSGSMGLLADALDELADALVYGLSIYAISGTGCYYWGNHSSYLGGVAAQ